LINLFAVDAANASNHHGIDSTVLWLGQVHEATTMVRFLA
jgi:hypothetical protein